MLSNYANDVLLNRSNYYVDLKVIHSAAMCRSIALMLTYLVRGQTSLCIQQEMPLWRVQGMWSERDKTFCRKIGRATFMGNVKETRIRTPGSRGAKRLPPVAGERGEHGRRARGTNPKNLFWVSKVTMSFKVRSRRQAEQGTKA